MSYRLAPLNIIKIYDENALCREDEASPCEGELYFLLVSDSCQAGDPPSAFQKFIQMTFEYFPAIKLFSFLKF